MPSQKNYNTYKKYLALRKRPYATDNMLPLFVGVQPLIVSEVSVDQPTEKTDIPYDCDRQSMHNSVVEVTVQKHISQTTMLVLQQNNNQLMSKDHTLLTNCRLTTSQCAVLTSTAMRYGICIVI